jgi:hypothetical protein
VKAIVRIGLTVLILVAALCVVNTLEAEAQSAPSGGGIWMDRDQISALPTSGSAWTSLKAAADSSCGTPDLVNQEDPANVCVMAKALVYARTGTASYASGVVSALRSIVNSGSYSGRALALGRELAAYVIAADLIDLASYDPALDQSFRTKIRSLANTVTTEAGTLIQCHENRPNNWGTHCGASRAAVAAYLGDATQLARIAQVFRGWLGERSSYAGFNYGDLSWQCNSSTPVGINPAGCSRSGHDIGGVLPDDQRRAGGFTWPAPRENYTWEALQGALAQATILHQAGYDVFNWGDRALLRAVTWLYETNGYPADGDDTWQPHVVNYFYRTSFSAPSPSRPGKNVGWTDWTHRGAPSSCSYSLSGTSATVPAVGGGTQVSVTTGSGCAWTASSNASWVTLSSQGGTGNGTVVATIAANTSTSARTGIVTAAGRTFTVNQEGAAAPSGVSAPTSPAPASGAASVSTTPTLSWTCAGAASYAVRLGTSNPPPQVATGVTATSYRPGTLTAGRTYYWQVTGVSGSSSTSGAVWSFSTASTTTPPPPPPSSSALPAPWTRLDIGVGLAGSAAYAAGAFTLAGSGAGIAGTSDAFELVHQPLTGHSSIVARLTGQQAANGQAQAGIMMREGRDGIGAGAAHATLTVGPGGAIAFVRRSATGASTSTIATTTQAAPVWLRLVRNSTTVTASVSTNGTTWRTVGSTALALTSKSVVGLAVSSRDGTQRNTATFDNVTVQ